MNKKINRKLSAGLLALNFAIGGIVTPVVFNSVDNVAYAAEDDEFTQIVDNKGVIRQIRIKRSKIEDIPNIINDEVELKKRLYLNRTLMKHLSKDDIYDKYANYYKLLNWKDNKNYERNRDIALYNILGDNGYIYGFGSFNPDKHITSQDEIKSFLDKYGYDYKKISYNNGSDIPPEILVYNNYNDMDLNLGEKAPKVPTEADNIKADKVKEFKRLADVGIGSKVKASDFLSNLPESYKSASWVNEPKTNALTNEATAKLRVVFDNGSSKDYDVKYKVTELDKKRPNLDALNEDQKDQYADVFFVLKGAKLTEKDGAKAPDVEVNNKAFSLSDWFSDKLDK